MISSPDYRDVTGVKSVWRSANPKRGVNAAMRSLNVCVVAVAAALSSVTPAAASWQPPPLGIPDTLGHAVGDINANRSQLAAATGSQFAPVTTSTANVLLPATGQVKKVTLKRTRTTRGGPVTELVQASPAIGPWAATTTTAIPYLSYRVDSVAVSSYPLLAAGFAPVAVSGLDFAIWKSPEGLYVQVIDEDLVPAPTGTNVPQAPIDLGPPADITISPCDTTALRDRMANGLGVAFRPQFQVTLPWVYADGSHPPLLTPTIDATVDGGPLLVIETPIHAPSSFGCTATYTPQHLVYATGNPPAGRQQLLNAGLPWVAEVPGIASFHKTPGGVFIEVVDDAFFE